MNERLRKSVDKLHQDILDYERKGNLAMADICRRVLTEIVAHEFWRAQKREISNLRVAK
jgi:hypothetical protein